MSEWAKEICDSVLDMRMCAHDFLRRVHGRDYTITIANKYVGPIVQEKAYFASAYAKNMPEYDISDICRKSI